MSVEVINVSKRFGSFVALNNVSLQVRPGELLALLGPSGSGKTTLLRIIGGLEFANPGEGKILLGGEDVTLCSAGQRKAGFVFQHYALFRHLTVFENVAFGLRVKPRRLRPARGEIRERVSELLRLVQLDDLAQRYPAQLSGGQRQRVALARALAVEPRVLLLDEPFGALDAKVRKDLRRWIRRLHREIHVTSIFVTHDQDEAMEIADRVVIMNKGRIQQIGTPDEVYDSPANPFVYNFLGHAVALRGRVTDGHLVLGNSVLDLHRKVDGAGSDATLFARPQDVQIHSANNHPDGLLAKVLHMNHAGPLIFLELQREDDGSVFELEINRENARSVDPHPGTSLSLHFKNYRVFTEPEPV